MCLKRDSICEGPGFLVDFYETCLQLEKSKILKSLVFISPFGGAYKGLPRP